MRFKSIWGMRSIRPGQIKTDVNSIKTLILTNPLFIIIAVLSSINLFSLLVRHAIVKSKTVQQKSKPFQRHRHSKSWSEPDLYHYSSKQKYSAYYMPIVFIIKTLMCIVYAVIWSLWLYVCWSTFGYTARKLLL